MNTQSSYLEKPTLVNVIAWMTLACGIVNILWGLGASATAFFTIVGICCVPLTILPSILGIFEILYASKLLSNPPQVTKPSTTIAVFEIACILAGNVFAMVVGILSLVFYNDQVVKDYFARLNGTLPPEPIPPAPRIPPVVPTPAAPVVEPIPSPITGEATVAPPAPDVEPEPPVSPQETIVTSIHRDGEPPLSEPEQPSDLEDPDAPRKNPEA